MIGGGRRQGDKLSCNCCVVDDTGTLTHQWSHCLVDAGAFGHVRVDVRCRYVYKPLQFRECLSKFCHVAGGLQSIELVLTTIET